MLALAVLHGPEKVILKVKVDQGLIMSEGRKALEDVLSRLQMYRITTDVGACKLYFEGLL